jgi:hypothetical protein
LEGLQIRWYIVLKIRLELKEHSLNICRFNECSVSVSAMQCKWISCILNVFAVLINII